MATQSKKKAEVNRRPGPLGSYKHDTDRVLQHQPPCGGGGWLILEHSIRIMFVTPQGPVRGENFAVQSLLLLLIIHIIIVICELDPR